MSERAAWWRRLPRLSTPAVVVDVDQLEVNLGAMARRAADMGAALRPHAKTHKCRHIARRQLAHGARGLSVATLGEAEYFADDGVTDLFVAYPLWPDDGHRRRVAALAERVGLRVGVDSPEAVAALGRLGPRRRGGPGSSVGDPVLAVLVEIDSGQHRSGVPPEAAADLAVAAERAGLSVVGVFTFPGHSYEPGARWRAAREEAEALGQASRRLVAAGFEHPVRSGGSTPTARLASADLTDELRPGVYAFNDAQQLRLGCCQLEEVALVVVGTVVSAPAGDRVILDAGSKALGADRPWWMDGFGLLPDWPGTTVQWLSEHHAVVGPGGAGRVPLPAVGTQVAVVPNHVCAAVNLTDQLVAVRSGVVEGCWEVAPRSSNR